ncbi:uncharacterized protein B0H18DRAFT_891602 [Fomitopsis serialis]|uniref:uncharacterized protein n=1 Tax=Fomitopsis serialis TaxID=139415 RepID=UPI0020083E40|nr:uncharacterized protein B0H18DRAFT_891602 [Neoantrodia serialis]KAH9911831.1 hypothetical protein B0H18DRAFT_891602 [Neoantrodia serialis]
MESSTVAEQRATAVAKLKRAASLPRMKDGRRPPMHVEAVSEGERMEDDGRADEEIADESDVRRESQEEGSDQGPGTEAPAEEAKVEDTPPPQPPETPVQSESTPTRTKRRSRSRTRSRGSRDMKNKTSKHSPHISSASHTNESSADEFYPSAPGEDAPPSPVLVSPIPSQAFMLPASRLLASPLFMPGTQPPTPLPTLNDLQTVARMGLYRSNSAGAARAMAMSKLTGEPVDLAFISPSATPPPGGARLQRNNTVSGGERLAARRLMLNRLGNRINATDGDQTSGGEEAPAPVLPPKRRRRRSKRASSRASTVVDDREEREPPSTTPNTPLVPQSPLLALNFNVPEPPRPPTANGDAGRASPLKKLNGSLTYDWEKPTGHRGVVVEDEDDAPEQLPLPKPPVTPARGFAQSSGVRLPHSSDAPSSTSTDSAPAGAIGVPVFLSRNAGLGREVFPASPFATPFKEKPFPDDDEQVPYQETRSRSRLAFERESEISWVAEPLPVERPPVEEDEDDEDMDDEDEEEDVQDPDPEVEEGEEASVDIEQPAQLSFDRPQLTARTDLVVDLETSPEPTSSHIVPSPISPIAPLSSPTPDLQLNTQISPVTYPRALAVGTPSQLDRVPSAELSDWEDRARLTDSTIKRPADPTSAWERVKNTFGISRSASASGRRSRTNSINARDRRNNTDSSVSRDSRVSLSKEKGEHAHPDTQPPSASTSMLSLPAGAQMGLHSPVPPATPVERLMYETNSKLHPFPGLKPSFPNMKADGKGGKPMTPSASSPDVASPNGLGEAPSSSSSNTATWQFENGRERKLSHQASDSRLLPKFNGATSPPPVSAVNSNTSQGDYFSVHLVPAPVNASTTGSMKLPMNREGVKKWLSAKKLFSSQTSPVTSTSGSSSPPSETRPRMGQKKGSFSDLLPNRKEIDNDWEEPSRGKSPTPLSPPSTSTLGKPRDGRLPPRGPTPVFPSHDSSPETVLSPRPDVDYGRSNGVASPSDFSASYPSPPDPPSSTTPDPQSSLDDFPIRSTSESYSDSSLSHRSTDQLRTEPSQSAFILERLEEVLGRGTKASMYPDDPPRKLVMSSPLLQVANANTVKDRFLFLFNDILVIAKPIVQDHDALLDTTKPSPLDRKFIVKSVCQLRDLRLCSDRDEPRSKLSSNTNQMRHPVIGNFVMQFSKDPDHAISALFAKTNCRDDPTALGQLLFRTVDLDRVRLGEYLSRRTSKVVLKAFVDTFGWTALRIDKALRVFLQAVNVPNKPGSLEYLLDSFASRWYEANAGVVAYDKDLAIRLVRAIVQLNEVMHGAIAQESGITGYPRRNVTSHDFVEAFRKFDRRGLVSDDLLNKVYTSVRKERLTQARSLSASTSHPDVPVTLKRHLPSRLTYRMQSEPVILRIPQPDPQLTIQLFGQDLVFDPPVLNFSKSSEASFRVTGTSLGTKSIIMWRSGPNGILYSGLPLSNTVVVERAFMRNTFQLAFVDHRGAKRKYMFSLDDPLMRHQWAVSIRRQIDIVASTVSPAEASGSSSKTYKANERLAFRVLQETLISNSDEEDAVPLSPVDQALARLNGGPSQRHAPNGSMSSGRGALNGQHSNGWPGAERRSNGASLHVRSKSRSKVYHRHGPGKFELELNDSSDARTDDEQVQPDGSAHSQRQRLWSGRDLDIVCRQNSLITPMLAYLQAGRRDTDMSASALS